MDADITTALNGFIRESAIWDGVHYVLVCIFGIHPSTALVVSVHVLMGKVMLSFSRERERECVCVCCVCVCVCVCVCACARARAHERDTSSLICPCSKSLQIV